VHFPESGRGAGAGVDRVRSRHCGGPRPEKFFDRVNHDILMGLVAKRVTNKRILKLLSHRGCADGWKDGPAPIACIIDSRARKAPKR
jgi:hypothetical protein